MAKFLKQLAVFVLLATLFVELACGLLIITNVFLIKYPGKEIYDAIAKSKQRKKFKKVVIGDSVGQQILPNENEYEGLNSLVCNQAISMVGQYILVNNYINAGNQIDTLIGFFNPTSFSDNLDQNFTYHYFLKPFDTKENVTLFSDQVNAQLDKIPYRHFNKVPHIYATSWAPDFENGKKNWTFLSPISLEYLGKIKDLSIRHHFTFILYPVPISSANKNAIKELNADEFKNSNLEREFVDYFGKIEYLNDSLFSDGTHLHRPEDYTEVYRKKLVK